MDIPTKSPAAPSRILRSAGSAFAGLVSAQSFIWSEKYLEGADSNQAMYWGALVMPWLVLWIAVAFVRRCWRPDELEMLINYRALSFAFYGLFVGLFAFDQMHAAELLPRFTWNKGHLLMLMAVLLLTGTVWSKWRYR